MSLISNIEQARSQAELHSVEVPEWDAILYWRDMTIADFGYIQGKSKNNPEMFNAHVLIRMALNEDGTEAFEKDDVMKLKTSADLNVVSRVANKIMEGLVGVDDAKED